jgi:hypothetical protein
MSAPVRQYTAEIHAKLGYWASWLPTTPIRLGDCGRIRDREFSPETTLERLGVSFEMGEESEPLEIAYRSENAVDYKFQLAVGNQAIPEVPQGQAGVEISFSKENGVVFVVRDGRQRRIQDLDTLASDLESLIETGGMRREYAVVTHVVDAASASVLISSGGSGKFVASAQADLKAGLIELANGKAGFSRLVARNIGTELLAREGLTPLYKLFGFKKSGWFWGSPKAVPLGLTADSDPGALAELAPAESDSEE